MTSTSRTSPSLLAGLRDSRDAVAWQRFYDRYKPMLLSFSKRVGLADHDAQEVVGETFVAFFKAFRQGAYDPGRGRLCHWLKGIARHRVQSLLSRRRTREGHRPNLEHLAMMGNAPGSDGTAQSLDDAFDREWELERVAQALAELRQEIEIETYQAFDFYVMQELPVRDVAQIVGIRANGVYLAKSRCLKRLRQIVARLAREED